MTKTLRFAAPIMALIVLAVSANALAAPPAPKTFVATLTAADEVPVCAAAGSNARGNAALRVLDASTGLMSYQLVANNIPGDTTAAHIHLAPSGAAGPVAQALAFPAGAENGVIGKGTFTNKPLLDALQANPTAYYVNLHSTLCPAGAVRGQLGEHGPPGTAE